MAVEAGKPSDGMTEDKQRRSGEAIGWVGHEEVALALACDEASHVTGVVFAADGGPSGERRDDPRGPWNG